MQLQHKLTTLRFCAGLRHCWCSGGSGHEQNHSVQETMVIPKRSGCDPVVGLHFWSWQLLQFRDGPSTNKVKLSLSLSGWPAVWAKPRAQPFGVPGRDISGLGSKLPSTQRPSGAVIKCHSPAVHQRRQSRFCVWEKPCVLQELYDTAHLWDKLPLFLGYLPVEYHLLAASAAASFHI